MEIYYNIITCYGWYDGEAGFENKHELPHGGSIIEKNVYLVIYLLSKKIIKNY